MVSVDLSLLAEIVLFVSLIFILNILLYKPLLEKMAQRKHQLDEKTKIIRDKMQEYDENQEFIHTTLNTTQKNALERIQTAAKNSENEKSDKINEAVEVAIAEMNQIKSVVNRRVQNVEKELRPEIGSITKKIAQTLLPMILIFFLVMFPAMASESTHEAHGENHGGGISETARTFNFIVMIAVLYVIGKKPVSNALKQRIQSISTSFRDREEKIHEIEKSLVQIHTEREHLPEIEKTIWDDAEGRVHDIQEKYHSETELQVKKIHESTEKQKLIEIDNAEFRLRKFVVEKAIEEFRSNLSEGKIELSTDAALIEDCLKKMPKMFAPAKGSTHG